MRLNGVRSSAVLFLAALTFSLSACGKSSSTDTIDNSQITQMNAGGEEGTINDMSVMDGATNSAVAAEPADSGNATDNSASEAMNQAYHNTL